MVLKHKQLVQNLENDKKTIFKCETPRKLFFKSQNYTMWRDGVGHFVKKGIARQTVYNDLNRCKNGQSILEENRSGHPSSWTSPMKGELKRLVNNRKGVRQRMLGGKLKVRWHGLRKMYTSSKKPPTLKIFIKLGHSGLVVFWKRKFIN